MLKENSRANGKVRQVIQQLSWGDIQQERPSPPDTMFATTGRKLYVIGDIDGGFRPRNNPYDMYTFGAPQADDPLANRLQGVWAQPVKALNGYSITIEQGSDEWELLDAERFTQNFSDVRFFHRHGDLTAVRTDFVSQDHPVLFTTITLLNHGLQPVDIKISFFAYFDLRDAQFITLAGQPNLSETAKVEGDRLVACASQLPEKWAVAVGGETKPAEVQIITGQDGHPVGVLKYTGRLEPGIEQSWTVATVVEIESGAPAALKNMSDWLLQREALLKNKQSLYYTLWAEGPHFHSPDAHFDAAFEIARANIQLLEAETQPLGRFFFAGLETFPFWFSADGAYCTPGLLAAGFASATKNHLLIGTRFDETGGVAHQYSPSGEIVVNGNTAETPLWIMAAWDTYRWTGDRTFLEAVYPYALQGLLEHTLGRLDPDHDGYPSGPGLVEREDMGAEKLDSASYTWAALSALGQMSVITGDTTTSARLQDFKLAAGFDAAWWDELEGTYSMSLSDVDNSRLPVPHWAIIVPLEVGLASAQHAATTFSTIRKKYLNDWGLKHTVGDDERVWTLPTATLSRAAYRYGQFDLAFQMLKQLTTTLDHGSIGMYHELIPEGLSFLQLWSAAAFLRGVVEDLMGLEVRADLHTIRMAPHIPEDWNEVELEKLSFGGHIISVHATASGLKITHTAGPAALTAIYQPQNGREQVDVIAAGESRQW